MPEYKRPCGAESESPPEERWQDEIACVVIGCRNCKNFNGAEFYHANLWRGIAMLAKRKLDRNTGGNDEKSDSHRF